MRKWVLLFGILSMLLLVSLASACGGGGGGGAQTLTIESNDDFSFGPGSLTAKAGTITFQHVNKGVLLHNFSIEGVSGEILTHGGQTGEETFTLEAGTYTFYCDQGAHREAGMEGTLIVQ